MLTDEQLISLANKGEEEALTELVSRYLKLGYFIAYQYTNEQFTAEDITQEIFVKLWQNLKKFDTSRKFKAWFYQLAKNTALDNIKKRRDITFSEWEQNTGHEIEEYLFSNEELSNQIDQDLANRSLTEASSSLSAKYVEVLEMYHKKDMNFREIAEVLGESVNTVKSRYRRAVISLKQIIKEDK